MNSRTPARAHGAWPFARARRIGLGAAITPGAVAVVHGGTGRTGRVALLDVPVQLGRLADRTAAGRAGGRTPR